jgi:hypothetical protein
MTKPILLGLLLAFCCTAQAQAGRLEEYGRHGTKSDRMERYGRKSSTARPGAAVYYGRGVKGRKYARRLSLRGNLRGDKQRIYDEYGYTPHRLGFNMGGRRTERWKYYGEGIEFTFDDSGKLLKTRRFPSEDNHID